MPSVDSVSQILGASHHGLGAQTGGLEALSRWASGVLLCKDGKYLAWLRSRNMDRRLT